MNGNPAGIVIFSILVLIAAPGAASAGDLISTNDTAELTQTVIARQVRHLPLEGAANFRDLGGYPTVEGKRVRWGLWLRGRLNGPKDSAQIFHCTGGADRTGFAA